MNINDPHKYFGAAQIQLRMESISQIVSLCLNSHIEAAPYVALLYCFSNIDLMGAYLTGRYDKRKEADNAKKFMVKYMHYSKDQMKLVQQIYRHKLVHSGMPAPLTDYQDNIYTWRIHYSNKQSHLKMTKMGQAQCLNISVKDFGQDLIDGMNEYLNDLENDTHGLRKKFEKTLDEFWGLNLIPEQNKV